MFSMWLFAHFASSQVMTEFKQYGGKKSNRNNDKEGSQPQNVTNIFEEKKKTKSMALFLQFDFDIFPSRHSITHLGITFPHMKYLDFYR